MPTPPKEMFPLSLSLIEDAIHEAVARFLVGASDAEIMAIAQAHSLDVPAVIAKIRSMIDRKD